MRKNRKKRKLRKYKRARAIIFTIFLVGIITVGLKEVLSKDEKMGVMADTTINEGEKEGIEEKNKNEVSDAVVEDENNGTENKEPIKNNDVKLEDEEEEIKSIISNIVGDKISNYGIYYYNLENGKAVTINEDKAFFAASTTKVALAMLVADKIQQGAIKSNQLITYKDEFYEGGAGFLMNNIKAGDKYEISKLVELMLVHSDNIATNMIFSVVWERDKYTESVTGIKLPSGKNMTTPRHQELILKRLYENPDNNPEYEKIIYYLKNTVINDRISKYIPKEIVAHKTGNYGTYMHDIGIVYLDKPYILCIYTIGEEERGRENIAKISEAIYNMKVGN